MQNLTEFVRRAEQIFLRPTRTYAWDSIVTGAEVLNERGETRRIPAVGPNTFRGFWRVDKNGEGPAKVFRTFFLREKNDLIQALGSIKTRPTLNALEDSIADRLERELRNVQSAMLESFNKLRKPVDLYLEHLVATAKELEQFRFTLVPLLYLPIDSQILQSPAVFSEKDLQLLELSRDMSYSSISREAIYHAVQNLAQAQARQLSTIANAAFHPIYYDLIWGGRHKNWGANLFETVPG